MMKLTYSECIEMLNALEEMKQVSPAILHVRISTAVSRNKRELRGIVQDVQSHLEQSEGYQNFMKEKTVLLKKHAERDSRGQPVVTMINTIEGPVENYTLKGGSAPGSPFAHDLEKLKAKYWKDIEEREKQVRDYDDFLNEESDFEPRLIPANLLPEKGIPQEAMDGLIYMIKEESARKTPAKKK